MRVKRTDYWLQLLVVFTRMALGGGFVFASIIKIKGNRFTTVSQEDAPFGTAMHFFETMYQTGIYWQFLGWCQLLAGFLLMTQRYSKLGTVINFPIILNVFVITISMDFNFTPMITGMMLLANTFLLIWHWNELKILLNLTLQKEVYNKLEHEKIWEITGLVLFVFTVAYRILHDSYDPVFWFLICLVIGLSSLVLRYFLYRNHLSKSVE